MKLIAQSLAALLFTATDIATFAAPSAASPAASPILVYLQFFHRWDTPIDDHAAELFSRIVKPAPNWVEFQRLVPAGGERRALFERHLASFEEAAELIRAEKMSEDLFFDAWYSMPASWTTSSSAP